MSCIGIMQPYFFPYIGYFELMLLTEKWLVFDIVEYRPKTWMTRNRILHPTKGWSYINLPVSKQPFGTLVHQIRVKDLQEAETRLLAQLEHYRSTAPYFQDVIEVVKSGFAAAESDTLVDANVATLQAVCNYLSIPIQISLCSRMPLDTSTVEHAGQWALRICEHLDATRYVNPSGGRDIFRVEEWQASGIELCFTKLRPWTYSCHPYEFEDHLSILDVLMWNSPSTVMTRLQSATANPAG